MRVTSRPNQKLHRKTTCNTIMGILVSGVFYIPSIEAIASAYHRSDVHDTLQSLNTPGGFQFEDKCDFCDSRFMRKRDTWKHNDFIHEGRSDACIGYDCKAGFNCGDCQECGYMSEQN